MPGMFSDYIVFISRLMKKVIKKYKFYDGFVSKKFNSFGIDWILCHKHINSIEEIHKLIAYLVLVVKWRESKNTSKKC